MSAREHPRTLSTFELAMTSVTSSRNEIRCPTRRRTPSPTDAASRGPVSSQFRTGRDENETLP